MEDGMSVLNMFSKKNKKRGRPKFKDSSVRKSSKMTVCLTNDYRSKLKKAAGMEQNQTPASLARVLIEEGLDKRI